MHFLTKIRNHFKALHLDERGMSLVEIIIVITLLGTVMTLVLTNLTGQSEGAKVDATKIAMAQIEQKMQLYKIHNYKYPDSIQDLLVQPSGAKKWRGPYIAEKKLIDPWNMEYDLQKDGKNFKIISAGPDQEFGTEDDVIYPDEAGNTTAEQGS